MYVVIHLRWMLAVSTGRIFPRRPRGLPSLICGASFETPSSFITAYGSVGKSLMSSDSVRTPLPLFFPHDSLIGHFHFSGSSWKNFTFCRLRGLPLWVHWGAMETFQPIINANLVPSDTLRSYWFSFVLRGDVFLLLAFFPRMLIFSLVNHSCVARLGNLSLCSPRGCHFLLIRYPFEVPPIQILYIM